MPGSEAAYPAEAAIAALTFADSSGWADFLSGVTANMQAVSDQVDTKALDKTGDTITGDILFSGASTLHFRDTNVGLSSPSSGLLKIDYTDKITLSDNSGGDLDIFESGGYTNFSVTSGGFQFVGGTVRIPGANRIEYRDSTTYMNSGAAGYLDFTAATGFRFNTGFLNVAGGTLSVGANDSADGELLLYGDSGITGGYLKVYLGATADGTYDYYGWRAVNDDLEATQFETGVGTNILARFDGTNDAWHFNKAVSIGTSSGAVPKGGIGAAKLAIEGTDSNHTAGPDLQFTTSADDYPLVATHIYSHDNIVGMALDAYYDGGWKSSDAGSNFRHYKFSDVWRFEGSNGNAVEAAIAWLTAFQIEADAEVLFSPSAARKFYYRDGNSYINSDAANRLDLHAVTSIDLNAPELQFNQGTRVFTIESPSAGTLSFSTVTSAITGIGNTFFGHDAGLINTSGEKNVAIGKDALAGNVTGSSNTVIGYQAGITNSNTGNTFIGREAGYNCTSNDNVFVGYLAGRENTATRSCAIGWRALGANTSGDRNLAIGYTALRYNETGDRNTVIGYEAALSASGQNISDNVIIGYRAGNTMQTGANSNCIIGTRANDALTTGGGNTLLGTDAGGSMTTGSRNTLIGKDTAATLTTGDDNIIIGEGVDVSAAGASDELNIGDLITGDLSAQTVTLAGQVDIPSASGYYLGDPTTDGTWRFIRSGSDLVIERRESGSYVTKSTVSA